MFIRIFGLFVLAFALSGTQAWAQSCGGEEQPPCSITDPFSPGVTSGTFDFGADGVITFQFDTVLTSFTLTVTANEGSCAYTNFDFDITEFPEGAVGIPYSANGGKCVSYAVVGTPNDPVRGVDYRGLISVNLTYTNINYQVHIPAFGHVPDATNTFENILTSYVDTDAPSSTTPDPTNMGGKTPGISPFAALDKPFPSGQGDIVCPSLTAVPQNSSGQNPIIEVSFKLVASNCNTDPPLRDKTATLSVANANLVLAPLVNGGDSNKFHFDKKNGVNVQDINTNKLPSGLYYVTVISTLFSPVTTTFIIP